MLNYRVSENVDIIVNNCYEYIENRQSRVTLEAIIRRLAVRAGGDSTAQKYLRLS